MAIVFMTDPATGRVAMFTENGTSGEAGDPDAPRNAPLNSPFDYLDKLFFHSDGDYMEVIASGDTVISHAAIAAASAPPNLTANQPFTWNTVSTNHLLLTHSLGYVPFALVVASAGGNSQVLWPGFPIQFNAQGSGRFVSAYATTTQIRLHEWASAGSSGLASIGITYSVLVFKEPPSPAGDILIDFDPATGITQMGRGKFSSDRRYLQVVPGGGTPFGLALGRTIDLKNGAPRAVRADGSFVHIVPAGMALKYPTINSGAAFGGSMAYNGSYAGPSFLQVQAP